MSIRVGVLALALGPAVLAAQAPVDSLKSRGDTAHTTVLQEITVTATPVRRETPQSSVTVTPQEIKETPAYNNYDLLRQTAGVEVHDQGQGPGFGSDLSIRGFSSDHSTDIALWIDGVPINEPVNGHAEGYNDWNLLFPQAVRQIDVIKGPTSALYGNFALAGTVNVLTIERKQGTDFTLDGGSYGRVEGSVLTGFDHGSTSGVLGIRAVREDGWRPNSGYDLGQIHGRLVHDLSSNVSLDAGVELFSAGWDSPGFLSLAQFDAGQFDAIANPTDGGHKNHAQERVSLRVLAGSSLIWRSTIYATQGRWQLFLTTPPEGGGTEGTGSQLEEYDHRYGFGATSALTWELPKTEITFGAEGRWDHSHYQNWFTTDRVIDSAQVLVSARQASGAVFVQSRTQLLRHLSVDIGGRYEAQGVLSEPDSGPANLSDTKGVFAPKFGVLYRIPSFGGIYGNVSRGYRRTDGVIEDPTLPFITEWSYETGVKVDIANVHASVALFQVDVSNEQTFDPLTLTSVSGGKSRRKGIDLGLETRLAGGLSFEGNFTILDAKYLTQITPDGDTLNGRPVFNTSKFVGSGAVGFSPTGSNWYVRVIGNIQGPYTPFDEPGVEVGTYALVHLAGGVRLGHALLSLGVRNLLDRTYTELRAGGFVSPGQPRTVYGGLGYGL
ncbi:MAG TPA: TonB-dependent receptor [Gemmatimonadales bacterium]|nr:TonB-dependent receptor [Gemmatimonadales bacterium]